jgi:hypothetical protein
MAVLTFATFGDRIKQVNDGINGVELKKKLNKIGVAAKGDVLDALKSDIGDTSMSNWRRKKPIKISARYDHKGDYAIEVKPSKSSHGPWKVLEDGRRPGHSKPTKRSPNGRRYSASKGKKTWSNAVDLMEKRMPDRLDDVVLKVAIRRAGLG